MNMLFIISRSPLDWMVVSRNEVAFYEISAVKID